MKVGGRNTFNTFITCRTSYLLNIVNKCTRRSHMIHPVNITDVNTHTECFCRNNHPFVTFLKSFNNRCLLSLVLLSIIRRHQSPVSRTHPHFNPSVYAAGKRIIHDSFMFIQKIIGTSDNDTLFRLIIILIFFNSKQTNIKADIFALHCSHKQSARVYTQRADGFKNHIIPPARIPNGSCSQCKNRKSIAQVLLQIIQVTTQEPIIHTEFLPPCSYRMCLIHHNQSYPTVTYKMFNIISQQ